jgi:type IV secretion system protein TrbL
VTGEAASGGGEFAGAASPAGSSAAGSPPDWAKRMRRSQTISHGASAATHAVKSGDGSGGGASVDLSEGE